MTAGPLSARSDIMESAAMKPEVFLPDDYRPAEEEPFMNERQLEYFRRKLVNWKAELLEQSAETIDNLQEGIAVIGSDGRLKLWNTVYQRLWGFTDDQLAGEAHIGELLDLTRAFHDGSEPWDAQRERLVTRLTDRTPRHERSERVDGKVRPKVEQQDVEGQGMAWRAGGIVRSAAVMVPRIGGASMYPGICRSSASTTHRLQRWCGPN